MFVMISSLFNDINETKCSLNFATRVRSVELGTTKSYKSNLEVKKLEEKVEILNQQLQQFKKTVQND